MADCTQSKRGELIRVFGNHPRQDIEVIEKTIMQDAKIHAEAIGEVQEAIDMCDFAVGLIQDSCMD